jgi:DNA adenine methylase
VKGLKKAFLKWPGNKRASIGMIKGEIMSNKNHLFGPFKGKFIEPFVGSAVVSLNIDFESYLLGDVNEDLMGLYNVLKDHKHSFIEYCKSYFDPEYNEESTFYSFRAKFNETEDKFEKAALFVYLNRHAFNGMCRYNASGKFNVPFGRYDNIHFPEAEMISFVQKIDQFEFVCQSFEQTIKRAQKEDVVYCDPPYIPLSNTASFTDYSTDGFGMDEQEKLAKLGEESNCLFLISNHYNDIALELYKNADYIVELNVSRVISAKAESRKPVKELLAVYKEN